MSSELQPHGPNAEQVRYWNEISGPKWVAVQDLVDALIAPLGELALLRAAPQPGERVLDVGCGCGATTLALARAVGPSGRVIGVDLSAPMLARARARIEAEGLQNVELRQADAQTAAFDASGFDLVFSRFGVMFFSDPPKAFENLRRALRPDGRCVFVCWQPIAKNPWMLLPTMALAQHVPLPTSDPSAPGPFAFADDARVRDILARAGFAAPRFESAPASLSIGRGDLDGATDFALAIGPAASALRESGADEAMRATVRASVRAALKPHASELGVRLGATAWVVHARPAGAAAADAERVVRDFCAAFATRDPKHLLEFLAPDCVYHNIPIAAVTGHVAIESVLAQFLGPCSDVVFELRSLIARDGLVSTERVDRFRFANGREIVLEVAGVFEVGADGRIHAWRDYFDLPSYTKQLTA